MVPELCGLIRRTIRETYAKYYPEEAVRYFLELYGEEAVRKDVSEGKTYAVRVGGKTAAAGMLDWDRIRCVFVLPEYRESGIGALLTDFLEKKIVKDCGAVWTEAPLPDAAFFAGRGCAVKEYAETGMENEKS